MTSVHAFTQKVELANEELHIVHCTFAIDKDGNTKFALIGDKVIEIENLVLTNKNNERVKL